MFLNLRLANTDNSSVSLTTLWPYKPWSVSPGSVYDTMKHQNFNDTSGHWADILTDPRLCLVVWVYYDKANGSLLFLLEFNLKVFLEKTTQLLEFV